MSRSPALTPDQFTTFGELLNFLRHRAGLSQRELSIAVGYSEAQISRLEQNQRAPNEAAIAARFVAALDLESEGAWVARLLELAAAARVTAKSVPTERQVPAALHNLPIQLTSFIGREQELAEITRLLIPSSQAHTVRLMTLTGPGGTGKTRLGLEVAASLPGAFPHGVWFIDLAPLSDPRLVSITIASVLRVHQESGRPLIELLLEWLRSKRLLLILDNCEHLISECARIADAILHASRETQILATSREALGIAGEQAYPVPSLSMPEVFAVLTLEQLDRSDAVRLFVDRAVRTQPNFQLTADNAIAITQICRRLDGIPLAIELAAARVKAMRVEQIAARLDDRFQLLTGGSRTALPRQQTLRATMDWSYDLLAPAERQLFCRLSVFVDGWTLEAAEAVCSRDGSEAYEGLDLLMHLIGKSLVLSEEQPDVSRYRMLETIRQYAREKLLESDEANAIRDRHLDYFVRQAEDSERNTDANTQLLWNSRLVAEFDNIRTALDWAFEQRYVERGMRLLAQLRKVWAERFEWGEERQWLQRALVLGRNVVGASSYAALLSSNGYLSKKLGEYEDARRFYAEELELNREIGDAGGVATALKNLGEIAHDQGNYERARDLVEEALELWRKAGNQRQVGLCLNILGMIAHDGFGDLELARHQYEESLKILTAWGSKDVVRVQNNFGNLSYQLGEYERALVLFTDALGRCRAAENKEGSAILLSNLGFVTMRQGDYSKAWEMWQESIALSRELGFRRMVIGSVVGWASILVVRRLYTVATEILAALEKALENMSSVLDSMERIVFSASLHSIHEQLSEQVFKEAWSKGCTLSLEQATALALSVVRLTGEEAVDEAEQATQPERSYVVARDAPPNRVGLTPRELEVLRLLASGLSDIQIGARLVISRRTVSTHLTAIYGKLAVNSRSAATRYALEHHLV